MCLRHRRRRRSRLAGLVRRRGLAGRHIARYVCGRGRRSSHSEHAGPAGHQGYLVHSRPLDSDLSGADEGHRRRRPRDRRSRLLPREPHRHDAGPRGGRAGLLHRPRHRPIRQAADGLRRALVGVQPRDQRAAAQEGHQVRPQPDAPRLSAILRPRRGQVDQDRLHEAAERVDETAGPRCGDGPDRDSGKLVPGRHASDDVHQELS